MQSGPHPVTPATTHAPPRMQPPAKAKRAGTWWRRIKHTCVTLLVGTPITLGVLWYAIHKVSWLGPLLADAARAVLGPNAVSWMEDRAYRAEDRYNRWARRGEKPQAHWEVPPADSQGAAAGPDPEPEPPPVALAVADAATTADAARDAAPDAVSKRVADAGAAASAVPAGFRPRRVGPLFPEVAAKGDGTWVKVDDPGHPGEKAVLYKTLLHVDAKRPWAELYVVAMDARALRVSLVAGTKEPIASTREGQAYPRGRKGLVPDADRDALVAAFNGGFKAEHGQLGMRVDGVTLLPPRKTSCTIAAYEDEGDDVPLRVATWAKLEPTAAKMAWWRQGPSCLVEDGAIHPGLVNEESMSWGSAVGGDTVIRRSALGLSADGRIVFVGVSNYTTARAIALGMLHAGADDVVQLDVNWSYPHFVLFKRAPDGQRDGQLLFDGFVYHRGEYTVNPTTRDFFYVTRR
jgi:Phosphodiester glycosidase